jgi:hypothetical protein
LFQDGLKPEDQVNDRKPLYANTAVIWLSSLGAGAGATNNTIKTRSRGRLFFSSFCIWYYCFQCVHFYYQTGESNDTSIQNNNIEKAYCGISSLVLLLPGYGVTSTQNIIGGEVPANVIGNRGIKGGNATGANTGNRIFNFQIAVLQFKLLNRSFYQHGEFCYSKNEIYNLEYTGTVNGAG